MAFGSSIPVQDPADTKSFSLNGNLLGMPLWGDSTHIPSCVNMNNPPFMGTTTFGTNSYLYPANTLNLVLPANSNDRSQQGEKKRKKEEGGNEMSQGDEKRFKGVASDKKPPNRI